MTATLSIRLNADTKARLDALSKKTHRSKSILAADAIAAYVETEEYQLSELQHGLEQLNAGETVDHERVKSWLKTWGTPDEGSARE